MRAEGCWRAGQFAAASQLYKDASSLGPLSARSLCCFGESLVQAGQCAEGRQQLLEALRSGDESCHPHAAAAVALSHAVEQQHDQVLAYCGIAEDLYWSQPQANRGGQQLKMARALRAIAHLRRGCPEKVLEELRSVGGADATADPGGRSRPGWRWDELIQLSLSRARVLCGDFDVAERHLEAARTLAGSSATDVLVAEAELRQARGDCQGAEELLLRTLSAGESPPLALLRLGELLLRRGQPGHALRPLQESLQRHEDSLAFGSRERSGAHLCLCVALHLSALGPARAAEPWSGSQLDEPLGGRSPQRHEARSPDRERDRAIEHLLQGMELQPDLGRRTGALLAKGALAGLGPLSLLPEQMAVLQAYHARLPAVAMGAGGRGVPVGRGGASPLGRRLPRAGLQTAKAAPGQGPDPDSLKETTSTAAPPTASSGSSSPVNSGRTQTSHGEDGSVSDNDQPAVAPVQVGGCGGIDLEAAPRGAGLPRRAREPELAQALLPDKVLRPSALELGECMSRGGFVAVRRGLLRGGGGETHDVVVKTPREGAAGGHDWRAVADLIAEIRIMSELDHPRIVPFVGACLDPDRVALVTLLAPGGNLHRALHVQQRQLAPREQLRLSLDLMEGVAHLHSRQPPVVHLDLKSMNLVLDAEGQRLQLCDFGLARRLGELGGRAGACDGPCSDGPEGSGSPRYMAPERYDSGLGPTTEKADVWSSACVLIEIFGGGLPHAECSNAQQILKALLVHRRGPSVPASAEAPVRSVIAGALAFEASERPTAAQVLAQLEQLRAQDLQLRAELQLRALEDMRDHREACSADRASHLHHVNVPFFVQDF